MPTLIQEHAQAHTQNGFTPLTLVPTFIHEHAQAHTQHRFTPLTLMPTFIHKHAQAHTQNGFTPLILVPILIHDLIIQWFMSHEHCAGPRTAPFYTFDTHAHFY